MKREIEAKLGEVDILVNCAGGDIGAAGGKPEPNNILGITYEDIKVLTNNNLIGTMLVCQAFVPPMVERRLGLGRQHRLGRRPYRLLAGGGLLDAEGGRRRTTPAASPRS